MSDKELSDAEYEALMSEAEQTAPISPATEQADKTEPDDNDDEPRETVASTRNSYGELRKLQRVMFEVAHTDPMGSARASAARVWRDLEILRLAKLGKPICLNTTGKLEPKRSAPSPMIALNPASDQQAAA